MLDAAAEPSDFELYEQRNPKASQYYLASKKQVPILSFFIHKAAPQDLGDVKKNEQIDRNVTPEFCAE
jgi:hypothetical protein